MPSPSSSLATLRPDLGGSLMEYDLQASQLGMIAHRVLPVFETMKQSGPFGKIPIEQLLQSPETRRAPGSGYNRGTWTFETDTYATEEHGWEEPVDDRESSMYSDYFDAEMVSTARARSIIMRAAEERAAALLFNATTWTGGDLTTGINNEWDDADNAVPIDDVEAAVQKVWEGSGLWPNALIINYRVFRNLRNVDQIVDRLKYQGFVDVRAENITPAALSQLFDLEVIVAGKGVGGTKNTANPGQAASLAPIWSDEYAMVCRVAETNDIRDPCIGRTFHWGEDGSEIGGVVETYRDENVRGDVVRCRHDVDEKTLIVQAGHLLSNVTT